jgi:nucleotide-binding universal stress UspA family protein
MRLNSSQRNKSFPSHFSTDIYIPAPLASFKAGSEMKSGKKLLVAVDGSKYAIRAAAYAAEMAEIMGASITLLNVVAPSESQAFTGLSTRAVEERELADEHLEKAGKAVKDKGIEFNALVDFGNPALTILKHAEGYDMIIVGHRGLSALQEMLMGSTSERVAHFAKIPVLIVP